MDVLSFVITVILITASGALAPGPLFFLTISHGTKSGARSGLAFSVAHTIIEFTLVMLLALGLLTVANAPAVRLTFGVAGGLVLLLFGVLQIRDSLQSKEGKAKSEEVTMKNLLIVGLAFTGLNPFFIVWWLTVGATLILLGLEYASMAGVVLMYVSHVWIDYVWLVSVSHFAKIGTNVLGSRLYRLLMAVFGLALIYFGLNFLVTSLKL